MKLRRITSGGRWIPEIDGLRFVAIFSVLMAHTSGQMFARSGHPINVAPQYAWLHQFIENAGGRGVWLFFVISGFILGVPFVRQANGGAQVKLKAYFLRRLTRLEVPYILALLIYLAGLVVINHVSLRVYLPHLLTHILYLHGLLGPHDGRIINLVTWSLEVEVRFYILAPVLALLFRIRPVWLKRALFVLCIGLADLLLLRTPDSHWLLAGNLTFFLLGFLLADLRVADRQSWHSWRWDLVSLVFWPLVFWLPENSMTPVYEGPLFFCAFLAALLGPWSSRLFRLKPIAITGGMCYSIYLMHMLFYSLVFRFSKHFTFHQDFVVNYLIQAAFLIPASIALSAVYFALIERPCMDPQWPAKLRLWLLQKVGKQTPVLHPAGPVPSAIEMDSKVSR